MPRKRKTAAEKRPTLDDLKAELPPKPKKKSSKKEPTLYCSFCGKSQNDVWRLIAGPGVYICNECIAICAEMILDGPEVIEMWFSRETQTKLLSQMLSPRRLVPRENAPQAEISERVVEKGVDERSASL
jgi:hypothetical protein